MNIEIIRDTYTVQTTLGEMHINGEFFCYTLEDTVRPEGIKVKHHTAIQEGKYKVIVNTSNRFKREMPLLLNVPMFEGIRMHGGNTHANTSGCPLVAFTKISDTKIYGTAEKELTKKIKESTTEVFITITNKKTHV